MSKVRFPRELDVFLPILDSMTPINPVDLNLYQSAISQIQAALGYGVSDTSPSTTYGPAGGNTDLAERLDAFLDPDGGLHDIAFITGTSPLGDFSAAGTGKTIPFGKTINGTSPSSSAYRVLFQAQAVDDGNGVYDHNKVPSCWWVYARFSDSVLIKAQSMAGVITGVNPQYIPPTSDSTSVNWCCLVIGTEAMY